MRKLAWITTLAALAAALSAPAAADTAIADMRGTWKGDSQSIVLGVGPHHPEAKTGEPRLTSVPFTLVIDQQDGRRFSGTFSSAAHREAVIFVCRAAARSSWPTTTATASAPCWHRTRWRSAISIRHRHDALHHARR